MKKNVYDIMDQLDERETEELLSGLASDKLDKATAKNIVRKTSALIGSEEKGVRRSLKPRLSRKLAFGIAACVMLSAALGTGAYAYAAESREYKEAKQFFMENDLSAEGLTRAEIKAVYRDITTGAFKYDKTAAVIEKTLITNNVRGWQIISGEPTPGDVERLWQLAVNPDSISAYFPPAPISGVHYKTGAHTANDPKGFQYTDYTYVEKYDGETLIWRSEFKDLSMDQPLICGDNAAFIAGYEEDDHYYSDCVVMLDKDGKILWKGSADPNEKRYDLCRLLLNGQGNVSAFGYTEDGKLMYAEYSTQGELIRREFSNDESRYVLSAICYKEGYLALSDTFENGIERSRLAVLDGEGRVTGSFDYITDESVCIMTDMIEHNGMVYISGYENPKGSYGGQAAREYAFAKLEEGEDPYSITSEELTPVIRGVYKAVLLMIDPEDGVPREFYTADGAIGRELYEDGNGDLVWDVADITAGIFSPATNAFSVKIVAAIREYKIDPNGIAFGPFETDRGYTTIS